MTTDEPYGDSQAESAADEFEAAMEDWQNGLRENALQRLLNARDIFHVARQMGGVVMCSERIGVLLFELGRYKDSLATFSWIRDLYLEADEPIRAARMDGNIANLYRRVGDLSSAVRLNLEARTLFEQVGEEADVAICDASLSRIYTEMHDHDSAAEAAERALSYFSHHGTPEEIAGLKQRLKQARRQMRPEVTNLASTDGAGEILNQIARNLDGPILAPEQLLPLMKDKAKRRLFEEILRRWKRASEHGPLPELAHYELQLGNAYRDLYRPDQALEHIQRSRDLYTQLRLAEEVAWTDIRRADALGMKYIIAGPAIFQASLQLILEIAIPAYVFLDSVRFRLINAQQRTFWTRRVSQALQTIFDCAADLDDAELVAELIEVAINVGIHVPAQSRAATGPRVFGHIPAELDLPEPIETGEVNMTLGQNSELYRYLAPEMLGLRPPPLLRMPNGKIALGNYIDIARAVYGYEVRNETVVSV
jgi:tetratricopeptide (TPR) repeat protein